MHLTNDTKHIVARVGGGYEDFRTWLGKNIDTMEKSLVSKMVQSRESLEQVCQYLIEGKPIRHHSMGKWSEVSKTLSMNATHYSIEKKVVQY